MDLLTRTDIINILIRKFKFKTYLEIGVENGYNLANVECEYKLGVDPNVNTPAQIHLTSNEFFELNKKYFDIVFIDGLHTREQSMEDIANAMDVVKDDGIVVVHDCNPPEKRFQEGEPRDIDWTGEVWKTWVKLRGYDTNNMFVVDTDFGVGVIESRISETPVPEVQKLTYENLEKNRKEWLNLIEPIKFLKLFS